MSEQGSYGVAGAVQGAQAGAAFGPVGAVVGGVIGAVAGAFVGGSARRSRILTNRARKTERMMSAFELGIQRRDMVRQYRAARAETVAAGASQGRGDAMSSPISGAISSAGSQANFNMRYFDTRVIDFLMMQNWYDKAGKAAANAQVGMQLLGSAAKAVGSFGGMSGPSPQSTQGLSYQTPSSSYAYPSSINTTPIWQNGYQYRQP